MPFDPGPLLEEFRDESRQQLDQLDRVLLALEQDDALEESSRLELLRVLHTLKGNSAMVGLRPISDQVHRVETVFKERDPALSRALLDAMFELSAAIRSALDRLGTAEQDAAVRRVAAVELPDHETESAKPAEPAQTEDAPVTAAPSAPPAAPGTGSAPAALPTPPADDEPRPEQLGQTAASAEVLRVPFAKLDELLAAVGELTTYHTRLEEFVEANERILTRTGLIRELEEQLEDLADLAAELRDTTMELRLVPLRTIFARFHTLVRELAREEGKRARLEVRGEEIEVDKSAADALAEPLLHLLRNAIDHGIEPPEERAAIGKPEVGTIELNALREGDQIRLEVADDGAGLDRAAILRRARAAGLVEPGAEPSPAEIADLVFEPGFSTRQEPSRVSGRGIGLDIVRRGIVRLRGSLAVEDRETTGTRFVLRLPLTLAIVPAVVFESAGEMLALAATDVRQTIRLTGTHRAGGTEVLRHDGALVPVARPGELFGWPGGNGAGEEAAASFAVIVGIGDRTAAVSADRVIGQQNLVVKAIPSYLGTVRGVSGVVPGAGGRTVLLLDGRGILDLNMDAQRRLSRAG